MNRINYVQDGNLDNSAACVSHSFLPETLQCLDNVEVMQNINDNGKCVTGEH